MEVWLDIHLSPGVGAWIERAFSVRCVMMRDLGLQRTPDDRAFALARDAGAIIMSKDVDFVRLVERHGPPPSVIRLTCGNTSNEHLCSLLASSLARALDLIRDGEALVEIGDA